MPTYYVEDYDGPRDDEPEGAVASSDTKAVDPAGVEDKAVKPSRTRKK